MIEEGLVNLVTADAAVLAIAPVGGFLSELPKGQSLPSWTYRVVSEVAEYTLQDKPGTTKIRRVYHLDRGYDRLDKKLRALGANMHRTRGPM